MMFWGRSLYTLVKFQKLTILLKIEEYKMTKCYYCPSCHNKTPYDQKYVAVICSRCQEEMFEMEDHIKNVYKVEVKEND